MKIKILYILLTFSYTIKLYSQLKPDSIVYWGQDVKLKSIDFQGKIPDNIGYEVAVAPVEIAIKCYWENKMPNFLVNVYFIKTQAWIKDTSEQTMAHEQLHFDIAELFARKIRKGILDLRHKHQNSIDEYDKLIKSLLNERRAMNIQYDSETEHGVYIKKQMEWGKRIANGLNELKKFEINSIN